MVLLTLLCYRPFPLHHLAPITLTRFPRPKAADLYYLAGEREEEEKKERSHIDKPAFFAANKIFLLKRQIQRLGCYPIAFSHTSDNPLFFLPDLFGVRNPLSNALFKNLMANIDGTLPRYIPGFSESVGYNAANNADYQSDQTQSNDRMHPPRPGPFNPSSTGSPRGF
jgi:hypothetical protein